ncbi:OsmC family protein [Acidobacteriia bacterium AH_259_A11_L15]|nr:OsmC family protein [Acidobacteriia bacterium AH_259_A11_L15]
MTGTLAGALDARQIPSYPDKLTADVEGFIEAVDGKPRITRIKVHYHLKVPRGKKAEAERAIGIHEQHCPVSQSVRQGIDIEFDGTVTEE